MCVCVVIKNKMQNPKIQENIIKTMLLGDLASLWGKVHIYCNETPSIAPCWSWAKATTSYLTAYGKTIFEKM